MPKNWSDIQWNYITWKYTSMNLYSNDTSVQISDCKN